VIFKSKATRPSANMAFPRAFQTYVPRTHCIDNHVYGVILVNALQETVVVKGRKAEIWSFPKGHGNYRELPLEASLRELREETGIQLCDVEPDDELRFRSGTYFVFFVSERLAIVPEDIDEVMEAMWVPISRLPYLACNKDLRSFCNSPKKNIVLQKLGYRMKFGIQENTTLV